MPSLSAPSPSLDGLGPWVRHWRHDNRWSQERLAEALAYEVSYVAKIERGRRRPTRQFLARLATVVDVDERELMQLSRQPGARLRLPASRDEVVGRDCEIQEVIELLRTQRCVTLVGAPGIGKTTMALEAAWRIGDDHRHGACFVSLVDVSAAAAVPSALVHHLGLMETGIAALDALLISALRHRDILLVLDNFEHVLPARTLVSSLLSGTSHVRALVTSREPLGIDGETTYPVLPLTYPDPDGGTPSDLDQYSAVRVFVARSRLERQDFALDAANAGPIMEICARLAGLPLAITLTAKSSRIMSPSDIARTLRARLELSPGEPGESSAHRSIAAALDWSWSLLSPGHRALLASLSIFSGGCSLAAVESVCSEDGDDIPTALAALERKSLIGVTPFTNGASRFVLLEPIRRYALEKLSERRILDDLRARHCAHFLTFAEASELKMTSGEGQNQALKELETEHSNLAAAFEWAIESLPESALRLGAALWRFYSMRRISEGRRWLTLALEGASGAPVMRARALNGLAILARAQGDLHVADAALAEARQLAVEGAGRNELAFATLTEGIVAEDRSIYEVAELRFTEAEYLYRKIGDERGVGHALNCLGVIGLRRGDFAGAAAKLHAALAAFRSLDDRWSIAVSATNLGWIAEQAGDLAEAATWYEETHEIWKAAGDDRGLGRSLMSLGRIARKQRRFSQARSLVEEALVTFHRLGDRRLAAACLGQLAEPAYERQSCDVGARLLGAAEALRAALGTPAWEEEAALEELVLRALRAHMGADAANRAYTTGRGLTLEDVVDMVRADAWPPRGRRRTAPSVGTA